MNVLRDLGVESTRPYHLSLLADTYGKAGQAAEGLPLLVEALELTNSTGERFYEAELYRQKGTLTLQSNVQRPTSNVEDEAEGYFLKAIEIARKQQAKSLELRAVMSLAQLRQQQAAHTESRITQHESRIRLDEAHKMLSEVYQWFTEGFDTKDLQEAKALIDSF
jgi:predicted ATPase